MAAASGRTSAEYVAAAAEGAALRHRDTDRARDTDTDTDRDSDGVSVRVRVGVIPLVDEHVVLLYAQLARDVADPHTPLPRVRAPWLGLGLRIRVRVRVRMS